MFYRQRLQLTIYSTAYKSSLQIKVMWLLSWLGNPAFIIFLITILLVYYILSKKAEGLPDGPAAWPVVGNIPLIAKNPQKLHLLLDKLYKQYGAVYTLWFGPFASIVISDINLIKKALVEQSDVFSDRPAWMFLVGRFATKVGIALDFGSSWKDKRRWTMRALRDFGIGKRSLEEKIQEEAGYMCEEIAKNSGKPFSVQVLFMQVVSNIICSVCFGQRFSYKDREFQELLDIINEFFKLNVFSSPINFYPTLRFLPGDLFGLKNIELKNDKMYNWINIQFERQLKTHDPENLRNFVDLCLVKEKEGYDRKDLVKIVMDLLSAGTETTSCSLRWLILYMIRYPDVQQKCQEEVDRIIGEGRIAALSDRVDMPYVDATIHELLRQANVAPTALPHDVREDTTLNSYKIPKHCLVFANFYSVHMNEDHWENPKEFRPERWIGKDGKIIKKDAFLPFSIGPRICPGESLAMNELFIFSCSLLQRFTFRAVDQSKPPSLEGIVGISVSPVDFQVIPQVR